MIERFPVVLDGTYDGTGDMPAMFRVLLPSGKRTDMVNLTRANDAAGALWRMAHEAQAKKEKEEK